MTLKLFTIFITVGSIITAIAVFLYYSISLYESSPEKSRIGYIKYLEILKLDIVPGENTALLFEGERLQKFLRLRVLILILIPPALISAAIRFSFL
jgi:hypothetical protein